MATRKRKETNKTHDFAPEIMREINRQTQVQEEIENRRNKRKLIFWSIVIFGTVSIAVITGVFLSLLGIVEW